MNVNYLSVTYFRLECFSNNEIEECRKVYDLDLLSWNEDRSKIIPSQFSQSVKSVSWTQEMKPIEKSNPGYTINHAAIRIKWDWN